MLARSATVGHLDDPDRGHGFRKKRTDDTMVTRRTDDTMVTRQNETDQSLGASMEDLLRVHFGNAERTLAAQHQFAIRLAVRHMEAAGNKDSERSIARLTRENETLRAQLALYAGPADAAAGGAAAHVDKSMLRGSGVGDDAPVNRVMMPHGVYTSEASDVGPRPPSAQPPRLPAARLPAQIHPASEQATMSDDSDDGDPTSGLGLPGAVHEPPSPASSNSSKEIKDLGRTTKLSRTDAFNLLEVWQRAPASSANIFQGNANSKKLRRANTMASIKFQDGEEEVAFTKLDSHSTMTSEGCFQKVVVHPYDPKRNCWDVCSLILVLWDMIMIPMGFFELDETTFLAFMTWTTRLFWTCDMPLSFISGYVTSDGTIELRVANIVRKYLKSWFALDVLVVGVDWLELVLSAAAEGLGFARLGKASRVFRILRMIRLLRLARMTEVISLLTERLNSEKLLIVIDIAKLMIIMVGSGHMLACLFYAIAASQNQDLGNPQSSWLVYYEFVDRPVEMQYVMSLRWAMSQFAGGMDEVTPKCLEENVYAIFVYLTAFWSGAVFLSILTSSMTQWYIIGSQNAQQLTVLRRYLSQKGISKKLALRVQRNAQHALQEQQRAMPEAAVVLIEKVSEPLKIELHFEMYAPNLSVHPFFHRYIMECPHVMRRVCHTAMVSSTVSAGDMIFNVGEIPSEPKMYIVSRGRLNYTAMMSGENSVVWSGEWIAEPTLWVQWVHRGTLTATADCLLFSLLSEPFQTIVGHFEHIGFDPRVYANFFLDCLNEADIDATDLQMPAHTNQMVKVTTDGKNLPRKSFLRRITQTSAGSLSGFLARSASKGSFSGEQFTSERTSSLSLMSGNGRWSAARNPGGDRTSSCESITSEIRPRVDPRGSRMSEASLIYDDSRNSGIVTETGPMLETVQTRTPAHHTVRFQSTAS